MRKARGLREVIRNESRHKYKHTSIGNSRNTRGRNKHKKEVKKLKKMEDQATEGKEDKKKLFKWEWKLWLQNRQEV